MKMPEKKINTKYLALPVVIVEMFPVEMITQEYQR